MAATAPNLLRRAMIDGGTLSAFSLRPGHAVNRALALSPLQPVSRRAHRGRLRVLAYHDVRDQHRFAAQLDWLTASTTPVDLDQARNHILRGTALPWHPVLVTFDDGDRSVLDVAAPLLRERGIPAVAYVVAGLLDTEEPFWWTEVTELVSEATGSVTTAAAEVRRLKLVPDTRRRHEIRRMRENSGRRVRTRQLTSDDLRKLELDGVRVGNHTWSHPCLDRCDSRTLHDEIVRAHVTLTDALGHPPDSFAYPNGNVDGRVREQVRAAGYTLAFAFDHKVVSKKPDPWVVSRVRVDAAAELDRFKILVSGLHPALHRMRGRT
jgi:peptidoglycan/xylan/chitin deacetylase (PgdA/CDA1 family)